MGKYRGYVVANKGGHGRVAMRDSGKTFLSEEKAINNMKSDNARWMEKNYNPEWVKRAGFEYGAVEDGKFKDGSEGNKKLLKWHDNKKKKPDGPDGTEVFLNYQLQVFIMRKCPLCKGSGRGEDRSLYIIPESCPLCEGVGKVKTKKEIEEYHRDVGDFP